MCLKTLFRRILMRRDRQLRGLKETKKTASIDYISPDPTSFISSKTSPAKYTILPLKP